MSNQHATPAPRAESTILSFNAPNISAVSCSATNPNVPFSLSEKRAVARALLRYNVHIDASTRPVPKDRLDPRYRDLHGKGDARGVEFEEIRTVTNETFRDALDAVSLT